MAYLHSLQRLRPPLLIPTCLGPHFLPSLAWELLPPVHVLSLLLDHFSKASPACILLSRSTNLGLLPPLTDSVPLYVASTLFIHPETRAKQVSTSPASLAQEPKTIDSIPSTFWVPAPFPRTSNALSVHLHKCHPFSAWSKPTPAQLALCLPECHSYHKVPIHHPDTKESLNIH